MSTEIENKKEQTPLVSVVMGLYNSASTLQRAIDSILSQSYSNFEFIICDDASTDNSYSIALQAAERDPRIIVLHNDNNVGCNLVLNRCIEQAKGEYIAIMDSDDISLPLRFEKEIAILESNPHLCIVSSNAIYVHDANSRGMSHAKEYPQPADFARGIPHLHPACMIRREALLSIGGYHADPRMHRVEDYYMMAQLYAKGYRGYNIQEPLLIYSDDVNTYSRRTWQNRINEVYTYRHTYRLLRLPIYTYLRLLRPLMVGALPKPLYNYLHRYKLRIQK